jgi:hypothetical protein
MVQETGTKPPSLTEEQLKKLLLEAIDNADDADSPETFHALSTIQNVDSIQMIRSTVGAELEI